MYNKIYVIAPYKGTTGGVELAHQLVDYLNRMGQKAFIVYRDIFGFVKSEVTPAYSCYNVNVCTEIEDDVDNILILPEIYFDLVSLFKNVTIGAWWMSVDNRYEFSNTLERIKFQKGLINKLLALRRILLKSLNVGFRYMPKNNDMMLLKRNDQIIHFYQSHYAQCHLYSKGFSRIMPLTDYINTDFINSTNSNKKNIILYNPSKGKRFTKKIISKFPQFDYIPLKGYTRAQLVELMQTAKLYMDFGHFPGKDRLFREAAMNGCCILTGKLGASYYYEDVPIPNKYKFDIKRCNIYKIGCQIDYIFNNYDECYNDFSYLRDRIKEEKRIFFHEIDVAFLQ